MSIHLKRQPTYEMRCDHADCTAALESHWEYQLRRDANASGWRIRPRSGKGSRTAPDLCPGHADQGGAS